MKKRGIYFLVIISLVIIVSGVIGVIAQSNENLIDSGVCGDNQVILTLSKLTNAQGGIVGASNHSVKVCYNSIFNRQYTSSDTTQCADEVYCRLNMEL